MAETAQTRLTRALKAKTGIAGQRMGYQPGDRVDYYKDEGPKDKSKWTGPHTIVDVQDIERGTVRIKQARNVTQARLQDLRQHMEFLVLLAAAHSALGPAVNALDHVKRAFESFDSGRPITLFASDVRQGYHRQFDAVCHMARRGMQLTPIYAARLGRGIPAYTALRQCPVALTFVWLPGQEEQVFEQVDRNVGTMNLRDLYPESWKELRSLQLFLMDSQENRFDDDGAPGSFNEYDDDRGPAPAEVSGLDLSLNTSLEFSDDGEDEYFFAGDDISIDAYYGHAANMAGGYL